MQINPYSIPPFISSIIILSLGIFVFIKNKKSLTNIGFSLICLSLFIWLISDTALYSTDKIKLLSIFSKWVYVGVTAIPITALLFIYGLLKRKINEHKTLFTALTFLYLIILYFIFKTNYIISGYCKYFWGYYPKAGHLHILYLILWILLYYKCGYLAYIHGYRNIANLYIKEERNKIKYGFWIIVFGSIGVIDFLAKYGLEIYPPGYVIIPIFCVITTYSIVKHKVMDINIVLQKGLVYSILVAFITIIYLIMVLLFERLLQGVVGYQSLIISILTALTIAIIFIPLKNKIQNFVDRVFFKGTFTQIAREKELLQQEVNRSERLKAVATFASGMAHEIKNPLTSIKTFAEYLPKKKNDSEFLNKFSKIVSGEVGRIDSLVHQLLDFAKPAPLNLQTVDINSLLDNILGFLNNDFLKYRIEVIKDYNTDEHGLKSTDDHGLNISGNSSQISGNSCLIKADSNQLRQAFLNLFLNAIDAMPSGGTLTVSTRIKNRGSSIRQQLLICVKDTGCGIPEEDLPHIFEPFYSKKESGTGLGLSIVYNIIKEHSGSIKAKSRLKEGTEFIIELPLQ
ncbi:MAG: hypothetical protein ISS45_03625 [Candidatus Omnitrophica bacterium]|nr:hypothetical protein [Candidatus Omnitrophota bacterium]